MKKRQWRQWKLSKVPKEWRPWALLLRNEVHTSADFAKAMRRQSVNVRCAVIAAFVVANEQLKRNGYTSAYSCPAHRLSETYDLSFVGGIWNVSCKKCVCFRITKMECHDLRDSARTVLQAAEVLYTRAFARLTKAEREVLTR